MKTLVLLLALVSAAVAQSVLYQTRRLDLPAQFTVEPHALTYLPAAASQIAVLRWGDIDLALLARQEPEIEAARQTAVLTGKKVYLAVAPPIHYMCLFMELPVNVQFNRSGVTTSQTRYTSGTTSFPSNTAPDKPRSSSRASSRPGRPPASSTPRVTPSPPRRKACE
ncbi:MAG: hypothetical protein NTV51_11750 [Verrucomicrobia bacterium]|nr:hypothetical protein [Verrucomicrobiota bacterium]